MIEPTETPPRVGDVVVACCDVLAEVARTRPGAPACWQLVEAGMRGKLIGWRERRGEEPRAVVDLEAGRRLVVLMRERSVQVASRNWHRG
jgi:hypothetical protein